uniref:Uncharacterized protein n=1 Tax=Arundo donax TaxID=35708 RepID=A0A0A9A4U1_ARUDO
MEVSEWRSTCASIYTDLSEACGR